MSENRDYITLRCTGCHNEVDIPRFCKYTGFEYGKGWDMICSECRGDLKEVKVEGVDALSLHPYSLFGNEPDAETLKVRAACKENGHDWHGNMCWNCFEIRDEE